MPTEDQIMAGAVAMVALCRERGPGEPMPTRFAEARACLQAALAISPLRLVIIESPYAGDVETNVEYARRCVRDSLSRGEAPIASHLLYTQAGILDDDRPVERRWGIDAGLAWLAVAQASAVYIDRGISVGMRYGMSAAVASGIPIEYRMLPGDQEYCR